VTVLGFLTFLDPPKPGIEQTLGALTELDVALRLRTGDSRLAADAGISLNTAVDVAKESAAIVMLDRGLEPVVDGVRLGRQTFAITEKYAFTTISANFGNVLSMAVAAVVLPFLPLLPRQILLTNFLTDIPSTTLAVDRVDPERAEHPQRWDIAFVRDFMIVFGLLSSAVDRLTFAILRLVFDASAELFRSGWFVESVITELTVLLVLRTQRPFYRTTAAVPAARLSSARSWPRPSLSPHG
jgi:P-type Mg2+ transporter